MATVSAPVSFGELIDKIAILVIKTERLTDAAKIANVRTELDALCAARDAAVRPSPALSALAAELKSVNETLWVLEDDIRDCERRKDFGADFIGYARAIYHTNDKRAELKRRVNELTGSDLIEEKSYQPY